MAITKAITPYITKPNGINNNPNNLITSTKIMSNLYKTNQIYVSKIYLWYNIP